MSLETLAQAVVDALAAYNAENERIRTEWKGSGYGKHFKSPPTVSDDTLIEMLEHIVAFDEDPTGTLEQLVWENEPRERDIVGSWPSPTDAEWDYAAAKGYSL